MMVVDASAVLAVVLEEDDASVFEAAVADAPGALISVVNFWEVIVRARVLRGAMGVAAAEDWLTASDIRVVDADIDMARAAALASERFSLRPGGRLNLGDCFAYALAAREGDGLLFKGNDFPKTDVRNALSL